MIERSIVFCLCATLCALPAAVLAWNQGCVTSPVGFGYKTTGGQGGRTVVPQSLSQLTAYLRSSETLIIDLQTTFDYTTTEGSKTVQGCYYMSCSPNPQKSINLEATSCTGRQSVALTYNVAGTTGLLVGPNKTIRSSNGKGVLRGKGLLLQSTSNVIIRDITITDINPEIIWGGDAITLNGVNNVWIHRCTIRRIGRMHLVSDAVANTGVTVSSCLFDGATTYSVYCDGRQYWIWLFWGTNDQITLVNNRVVNSAGRLPHAGGTNTARVFVHLIGNEFDTNPHNGIEPRTGAYILAEGNKFINMRSPVLKSAMGGYIAVINTNADAAACKASLGQNCLVNTYSATPAPVRMDQAVFGQFTKLAQTALNSARAVACES